MLEVKQQVRLPFNRLLNICLDSISYRLLRSMVTVVIILLAIAFLAVIMVDGYLGRATRETVQQRARRMTAYSRFMSQVSRMDSDERLVRNFSQLEPGTSDYENLKRWGGFTDLETEEFVAQSKNVQRFLRFFDDMPIGRRVLLVGRAEDLEIFDYLRQPGNLEPFLDQVRDMREIRLPVPQARFEEFLERWPVYREAFRGIKGNYSNTIRQIADFVGDEGVGAKLREYVDEGRAEEFFQTIGEMGYYVDNERIEDIFDGLEHQERLDWAYEHLRKGPVRSGWHRRWREVFTPGKALMSSARSGRRVEWIQGTLEDADQLGDFDADRFRDVAREHREWETLLEQERRLVSRYGAAEGLEAKTIWLIIVSFLVCVVGIANAMLMSVLERFKEIATMKCLGARNGTIAFLFVMESIMIGIVGGVGGIILGFIIVIARLVLPYGGMVFSNFPAGDMAITVVICFFSSLVLAMLAAIYPAWVASRMAPMEAMRVD